MLIHQQQPFVNTGFSLQAEILGFWYNHTFRNKCSYNNNNNTGLSPQAERNWNEGSEGHGGQPEHSNEEVTLYFFLEKMFNVSEKQWFWKFWTLGGDFKFLKIEFDNFPSSYVPWCQVSGDEECSGSWKALNGGLNSKQDQTFFHPLSIL